MIYRKEKGPKAYVGLFSRANVVSEIQGTSSHAPPRNVRYKVVISSFRLSGRNHYLWSVQVKFIFITRLCYLFHMNHIPTQTVKFSRSGNIAAMTGTGKFASHLRVACESLASNLGYLRVI